MMYIKTDAGNIVPWTAIKAFKATSGGTKILLLDNTTLESTRTFEEIVADTQPQPAPDLVAFATLFGEIRGELESLRTRIDEGVTRELEVSHENLKIAVAKLNERVEEVREATDNLNLYDKKLESLIGDYSLYTKS